MQKKATGEIDWDLEMAKGSQSSWKDEWLDYLVQYPVDIGFYTRNGRGSSLMALRSFRPCRSGINTLLVLLLPPALVYAVLQNSLVKGSPVSDVEYARSYNGRTGEEKSWQK